MDRLRWQAVPVAQEEVTKVAGSTVEQGSRKYATVHPRHARDLHAEARAAPHRAAADAEPPVRVSYRMYIRGGRG